MKTIGILCEIVRTEKKLLKESGYSDADLAELESKAGQAF
jgi:hypothetical protein